MTKFSTKAIEMTFMESLLPSGWVKEYRFHPTRKWRMDYAWPSHMIALEVEGAVWTRGRHTRGSGFVNDISKYNAATMLGWRVFRIIRGDFDVGRATELIEEAIRSVEPCPF